MIDVSILTKNTLYLFISGLLVIYVLFSILVSKKINDSSLIHKNQKTIHTVMVWLIPFAWYFLVKDILFSVNNKTMTKTKRKKLNNKKSNDFYESNKGIKGE